MQKFDFQPMKISFEFVEEKQFTEVLYPQGMYDLIDFSLRECIRQRIAMRTCKNCGRYFALTVHGSTEYCSRVFDSRGRTCKEVGAMRQYMQSHAQDELLKIYRREYKRRFAWIRAGKISQEAFSAWSKDAQKEKEKCENGEISQKEFTQWLKVTRRKSAKEPVTSNLPCCFLTSFRITAFLTFCDTGLQKASPQ